MDIETQKKQMNEMLSYLGRNSYNIEWKSKGNYLVTYLSYSREDSLLMKETIKYNHAGKVIEHLKKEKAMGGTNGDDMYKAIKKAARNKAEKEVLNRFIKRELEDNNVFL